MNQPTDGLDTHADAGPRGVRLSSVIPVLLALISSPLRADVPAVGHYRLTSESSAQVGCLDLCRCPIRTEPVVEGSFDLALERRGATFTLFRMDNVTWSIGRETPLEIAGAGTLQIEVGGPEEEQTIELELSVDGDPPVHFRSVSRRSLNAPVDLILAIDVRPADRVCRGHILELHATLGP